MIDDPGGTPLPQKVTLASIFGLLYPVGSIYISTLSTNPGTLLGVGTWGVFGAGKTLVSLDSGDTDFDTVEETRGAKTHTLVEAEMPAHTHSVLTTTQSEASNHTAAKRPAGALSADTGGTANADAATSTGGDGAHNNIQPSIVVYMWKRSA